MPTIGSQIFMSPFVSSAIFLNFISPKFIFHLMFPSRELPAVPKISIQEDTNLFFLENNVGSSANGFDVGFEFARCGFFEETKEGLL